MFVCWQTSNKCPVTGFQSISKRLRFDFATWINFATAKRDGSRVDDPYAMMGFRFDSDAVTAPQYFQKPCLNPLSLQTVHKVHLLNDGEQLRPNLLIFQKLEKVVQLFLAFRL